MGDYISVHGNSNAVGKHQKNGWAVLFPETRTCSSSGYFVHRYSTPKQESKRKGDGLGETPESHFLANSKSCTELSAAN